MSKQQDQATPKQMMPSERKELLDKITQLKKEKDQIYAATLRKVNGIIVKCEELTHTQRELLLELIWAKE